MSDTSVLDELKPPENDKSVAGKVARHVVVAGLGSISPLLLTALVFFLIKSPVRLGAFVEHGEAGICAVAVLLGAGLLISRELTPQFRCRAVFFIMTIILWTAAILLYALVRVNDVRPVGLDAFALAWLSGLVWLLSLGLSVIVVGIDAARERLDVEAAVRRAKAQDYEDLELDFKKETNDE